MSSGSPAWPPLALRKRWSPGRRSQGTSLQGRLLALTLVTAESGASGIPPTALTQVTDSKVLWTVVIFTVAGVARVRMRGGRRRRLGYRDARDWHGRRGWSHTPLHLPWPGHTHPGRSHVSGWWGSICNRTGRKSSPWGEHVSKKSNSPKQRAQRVQDIEFGMMYPDILL